MYIIMTYNNKLRDKYPDKIPVVINKDKSCKTLEDIKPLKYLIQEYITVRQLLFLVRKRIQVDKNESLYLYVTKPKSSKTLCMLQADDSLIHIYNLYHNDEDGVLYISYTSEDVFG